MKLYFWDWSKSLTIEKCDMEFPFHSKEYAESQDCYTSLNRAIKAAKIDLRERIDELQSAIKELDSINPGNVKTVKYMKGL